LKARSLLTIVTAILVVSGVTGVIIAWQNQQAVPAGGVGSAVTYTRIQTQLNTATMTAASPPILASKSEEVELTSVRLSERLVIYNADISLNVSSVQSAVSLIESIALGEGGYVSSSSVRPIAKGTYTCGVVEEVCGLVSEPTFTATMTIKIPAERYSQAQSRITNLGKVISQSLRTQDVTDLAVDLDGRLKNAQKVLEQYTLIMSNAGTIQDILAIQIRIDSIQERIEVLKAQIQNLQGQVTFATITIYLNEPFNFKEEEEKPIEDPNIKAITDSFALAASALRIEIMGLIFLVVGLSPIWIIATSGYVIYRTFYKEKKAKNATTN
jgi:hypothetical protein